MTKCERVPIWTLQIEVFKTNKDIVLVLAGCVGRIELSLRVSWIDDEEKCPGAFRFGVCRVMC